MAIVLNLSFPGEGRRRGSFGLWGNFHHRLLFQSDYILNWFFLQNCCVNSRQRVIQRRSLSRGLLTGERWQVDLFFKFQSSEEYPGPIWLKTCHSDMLSIDRWIKSNHNPLWVWILQLLCDEMRQNKDDIRNENSVYLRQGRVGPFDVNIHDKLPPYIPTPLLPPLQPCWDCQNTIWFLFKTWICFQNNIWIRVSSKPG